MLTNYCCIRSRRFPSDDSQEQFVVLFSELDPVMVVWSGERKNDKRCSSVVKNDTK